MRSYITAFHKSFFGVWGAFVAFLLRPGRRWYYGVAGFLFLLFCLSTLFFLPPLGVVEYPQVFIVSKGETVRSIGEDLRRRNVIISPSLFIFSNYLLGERIVWGSYHFNMPRGVFFHARDLYYGEHNMPLRRVTIPERSDAYRMADIFEEEFVDFDREEFLEAALEYHGYLYPDTYLFAEQYVSADHLIEVMMETFLQRTDDLFASYTGDLSQDEIVTLASIVELEASRFDDRRKIAQVLLNRLDIHMPLQVDVSFLFIDDKHTFQLSRDDLASNDPSNTYKYAGIPPIPITNPSRVSIEAVMYPEPTDALYFLADFHGNTYYSRTFEEHLLKKEKYIDSVRRKNGGKIPVRSQMVADEEKGGGDVGSGEGGTGGASEKKSEGAADVEAEQVDTVQGVTDTQDATDAVDAGDGGGGLGTPNLVILESGAVIMRE